MSGAIARSLLSKGFARLTDDEVAGAFGGDKVQSFTGPRGTILLEDTPGLHKGTPVRAGDRPMFELELSSSMFGAAPSYGWHDLHLSLARHAVVDGGPATDVRALDIDRKILRRRIH